MIRAAVRRDGPAEWSFTISDEHGAVVIGLADTWDAALRQALAELELLDDLHRLRAAAAGAGAAEVAAAAAAAKAARALRGPITPGDATVPAVDVRCDSRPAWWRWVGR